MTGLSGLNFIDGAMKGASFVAGMQDRQQKAGLLQAQEERAKESHAVQMENANQASQLNGMRISQINEEQAQKMNKALAWSLHNSKGMPEEYRSLIASHPNLDAGRIMSPEYGAALDTLEKASKGELDYRRPEVGKAFDMLNPEIQLGATGGRKVSTSRLYPGQTPGTLMVGLRVDGDPDERPLTENRSADPGDRVKEVPLEALIDRVTTAKQYRAMLADPKGQEWFIKSNIGAELNKSNLETQKIGLQMQKLRNDAADSAPTTYSGLQTDPETGQRYQKSSKGEIKWAPKGSGGAGANSKSSLEKEVEYLRTLGMTPEDALAYKKQQTGNDARDVQLLAATFAERENIPMDDYKDEKNPEVTLPGAITKAINAREKINKLVNGKERQPKPEAAPKPAAQPKQAPAGAIEALRNNPELKDQFQAKYGYLPE